MKGMTYGEMGDVALSMDSVTVDQYYKRLSIIYNKMCNISTGPFDSFEDFLKGFAYVDIPMALYGLYISTQPEIQQIQLRCGKSSCEKTFNWEFSTRSVLRLEKCSPTFLEKMKEIATSPAIEYDNIRNKSAVLNSKYIELPYSKFVIEMGVISAYEFLYNFIPVLDENTFKQAFGDDLNQIYVNNVLLLTTVRSVRIPNSDGTYTVCEGYKDILDAIYNIRPEEIKLVAAIANKLTSEYQTHFSFGDVVCPHCGNVTHDLDLTMDDLVFQTYQRLLSTEINVENIRGF
jgi:acetone carboxylase gamma subunit